MKFDPSVDYFYKYPADVFTIEYDFTLDISSGDALATAHASIWTSDNVNKTASMISNKTVVSPDIYFNISSGSTGETYSIKVVGTTDNSKIFTHYINCEVYGTTTLNSKLGDKDANSYNTLQEANTYIRNKYGRPNNWDTLQADEKKRLLVEAAQTINKFNYVGEKYYTSQPLEFPRDDHTVITGNCQATLTNSSFKHTSLKSSTYGEMPQDYWKNGACHLTDDNESALIASSNVTSGIVHMTDNFTASITTSTKFIVFKPLADEIKHAQCEQALYLIEKEGSDTLREYQNAGAKEVRIGDVLVKYKEGSERKIPISPVAKKLLSRWFRKKYRLARA